MMSQRLERKLRQGAEYTHKFNNDAHRHGWLRLTPAYSAKVVEDIIEQNTDSRTILDPFCGTGTTALGAIYKGRNAATIDINPFLLWLARAKTVRYSEETLVEAKEAGRMAVNIAQAEAIEPVHEPNMHNIERWWAPAARRFLCYLKGAIDSQTDEAGAVSDLLNVAFCRTLVKLSNATFNHQSMSFGNGAFQNQYVVEEAIMTFDKDLSWILAGAAENPVGTASVALGDARHLPSHLDERFDLVITSPPYANRMSYIRELRPYMYWLGWLETPRDAGELDWLAIGGTWGIATSRLAEWEPSNNWWTTDYMPGILGEISRESNKNGIVLAKYVAKYFEDMSRHFQGLGQVLNPGARVHYIVGNSTFYGVLVPTEQIYSRLMERYGFVDMEIRPIRKRNSKKELVEFDVSATWLG